MALSRGNPGDAASQWEEPEYGRLSPAASLPSLLAERLLRLCREGVFALGSRLPTERELAERFGVGRSTVREAMRILEHSGVIEVRQGVGAFVVGNPESIGGDLFDDVDLMELCEARYLLEGFAAELAASYAGEEDIARIRRAVEKLERSREDPDAFYTADLEFHEVLARSAGNRVILKVMRGVADALRGERRRMVKTAARGADHALATARRVLAAIEGRDRDAARAAVEDHLQDVRRMLARPEQSSQHTGRT